MDQGSTFGGCGIFDGVGHGTTYHWRVRGIDEPKGVLGLWSPVRSFIRRMPIPTRVAPANGATVAVPVLDWDEVDGASQYHVWVTKDGSAFENKTTYATEYTPSKDMPAGDYKWYVTTISPDGPGVIPNVATHSSFTVSPDADTASPDPITPAANAQSIQMPVMTWAPVTDATDYEVWYSVVGSGTEAKLGESKNPGYAHIGEPLPNGEYNWYVKPYDGNTPLTIGPPRRLDIIDIPIVNQTAPDDCPPAAACQKLTSSPTYNWDYQPDARFYLVTMAFDTNFTNILKTYEVAQNYFIPREEYPDNDAGQAYYWHVRPCKSPTRCGPDPQGVTPPQRAFQKRSDKVQLTAPANGAVVADQPRLSWQDYLASNGSNIEAERYRVQISAVPTFAQLLYNERIDQTFVTPFDRTLPEGPLYWRVRAIDGSGNELTWSNEQEVPLTFRAMTKTSPPPTMVTPGVNANVAGQPTFSWDPQAFAESYRLEVAKNGDLNFSPANEVLDEATAHAAFTAEDPLAPGTYAWRIRRDDGQGKDGPWSAGRLFTVTQAAPTLLTPVNGALVPNDQFVFTWTPLPRAVSYRFERSVNDQFSAIAETRNTVMTSWAPIVSYPQQKWYWRVKALDAKGNIIGTSNVFDFNRGADPIASMPQNLSIQQTPGRLRVFWQPPAYQGVPQFTDYVVTLQPGNVTRVLNRNTTNTTFNGLINGNDYDVTVAARSSGGDGPAGLVSGQPNGCTETTFSDIPTTHLFCSEIRWMFTTGLSIGSVANDGTVSYQPSQPVARQAMATFLYRYAGSPSVPTTAPHFADVPSNHTFFKEIQWMFKSGNSTGFPNPAGGKPLFKPTDAVDRGGMAAFMYRSAGNPTVIPSAPHFADVGVGHIFYGPIQWMFQSGVSFGTPNPPGKPWYNPTTALGRDAMAAFLFRYDQVVP
jgi:hypothetical protein